MTKTMQIVCDSPEMYCHQSFGFFLFQAACRKLISIPDLFLSFLLMISKRFSRPMEPQYIPKLALSDFSRSFCGAHRAFTFIPPCCRRGWTKGGTKGPSSKSLASLSPASGHMTTTLLSLLPIYS